MVRGQKRAEQALKSLSSNFSEMRLMNKANLSTFTQKVERRVMLKNVYNTCIKGAATFLEGFSVRSNHRVVWIMFSAETKWSSSPYHAADGNPSSILLFPFSYTTAGETLKKQIVKSFSEKWDVDRDIVENTVWSWSSDFLLRIAPSIALISFSKLVQSL